MFRRDATRSGHFCSLAAVVAAAVCSRRCSGCGSDGEPAAALAAARRTERRGDLAPQRRPPVEPRRRRQGRGAELRTGATALRRRAATRPGTHPLRPQPGARLRRPGQAAPGRGKPGRPRHACKAPPSTSPATPAPTACSPSGSAPAAATRPPPGRRSTTTNCRPASTGWWSRSPSTTARLPLPRGDQLSDPLPLRTGHPCRGGKVSSAKAAPSTELSFGARRSAVEDDAVAAESGRQVAEARRRGPRGCARHVADQGQALQPDPFDLVEARGSRTGMPFRDRLADDVDLAQRDRRRCRRVRAVVEVEAERVGGQLPADDRPRPAGGPSASARPRKSGRCRLACGRRRPRSRASRRRAGSRRPGRARRARARPRSRSPTTTASGTRAGSRLRSTT